MRDDRKELAETRRTRLLELHAKGWMDRRIASDLGVTVQHAAAMRREAGLAARAMGPADLRGRLVRRLHGKGLTDREAAAEIGCSKSTFAHWRREEGLVANSHIIDPEKECRLRECYALRMTDAEAAEVLGVSRRTVVNWRNLLALPPIRKSRAVKRAEDRAAMIARGVRAAFSINPARAELLRLLEPHLAAEMAVAA